MSESNNSSPSNENSALVLPAFGQSPKLSLEMSSTREAERRLIEAKTVNPLTFADLSHCYNESYRELKKHSSTLGYQLTLAEKALEAAKATVLLDKYPDFMKDKPKTQDNADLRKAYMMRDADYLAALDRINQLKAIESFVEGRIKIMERVCSYMKTQMDILTRSGLSNANMYVTSDRK